MRVEACGVCHTDLYTASGADPTGYSPCVLGPRGRGRRRGDRRGRDEPAAGRSRDHAVRARVRRLPPLPQPAHQPLSRDPRSAGSRPPARRHDAPLARRRGPAPLHGHLDVRRGDRHAGDRPRQGRPGRAARGRQHLRLRAVDGTRRRDVHREGRGRLDVRRLRLRARGPRRDRRLPAAGRRADLRDRPLRGAARDGASPRRDRHDARLRGRRPGAARSDDGLRLRLHLRGDRPRRA